VDGHAVHARRVDQAPEEEATILVAQEHRGAVVSALDNVQDRTGKPESRLARHPGMLLAPHARSPSSEWRL